MMSRQNTEWHTNGIMFFCIFTIIMSFYSALDLHGFFVADFFKNNAVTQMLDQAWKLKNMLGNVEFWIIYGFFTIKIILAIGVLKVTNNVHKIIPMLALYALYAIESIISTGYSCGAKDGSVLMCAEQSIINPVAALIISFFLIVLAVKQLYIGYRETNDIKI